MSIELEEYLKTGLLGAYHPDRAVKRKVGGKVLPLYRDTVYTETDEGMELKREMVVGGRMFIVRSAFPAASTATPTQTMLLFRRSPLGSAVRNIPETQCRK